MPYVLNWPDFAQRKSGGWHLPVVHPGFWLWFAWVPAAIPIRRETGSGTQGWVRRNTTRSWGRPSSQHSSTDCTWALQQVLGPQHRTNTNNLEWDHPPRAEAGLAELIQIVQRSLRGHFADTSADRFMCGWATRLGKHRLEAEVPEWGGHQAEGQGMSKSRILTSLIWSLSWSSCRKGSTRPSCAPFTTERSYETMIYQQNIIFQGKYSDQL